MDKISPWLKLVAQANDPFPFTADKDLSQQQLFSAEQLMHSLSDKGSLGRKQMWLKAKREYDRMKRINAAKNLDLSYYADPTYRGEAPDQKIVDALRGNRY